MNQETFWNGEAGERWVREQERLDRSLGPIGELALAAAQAKPGERVLDVGCGCGATALALADAVGKDGAVVGVDLSAPMLLHAKARAAAARLANLSFEHGDATTFRAARPFDLAFSRFGVMFFEDPIAAFTNVAGLLRPGGRVAFVCWRAMADNPWVTVPLAAVLTVVPAPEPTPPDAPGPFSFADAGRVEKILAAAGFANVRVTPRDTLVETGSLDDAVDYAMLTGPAGRLALAADLVTRAKMKDALQEALRPFLSGGGVALPAAVWIVTGTRTPTRA